MQPICALVYFYGQSFNKLFLGGMFSSVANTSRNRIASINLLNNQLNPLNLNINDFVFDIEAFGNRIFVGGKFTTIGNNQIKG